MDQFVNKTPAEIRLMQQAVVETALAYFWKGASVRYSWLPMTIRDRKTIGESRMHAGAAPELASRDFTIYSHCADWINSVYLNAFNHNVGGAIRRAYVRCFNAYKSAKDPDVVLRYGGDGMTDAEAFIEEMEKILQPADIFSVDGHTMLYLGDCIGDGKEYVLHCTGAYSTTDFDGLVALGNIRIAEKDYFIHEKYPWGARNQGKFEHMTVMRPINVLKYEDMTESAKQRLTWPMLEVDRYTSLFGYSSAQPGQVVTVTTTVFNHSRQDYRDLPIVETLPVGARLHPSGQQAPAWCVDVPAGTGVSVSYQVQITASRGETVTFPGGTVGGIPTRTITNPVGGRLFTPKWVKPLEKMAGVMTGDVEFANAFYRNVMDLKLDLPSSMQEVLDGLFDVIAIEGAEEGGGHMLQPKPVEELSPEFARLHAMLLPEHKLGQMVWLGSDPDTYYPKNRVTTYYPGSYAIGDIFLCLAGEPSVTVKSAADVVVYVYLGEGKVACMQEGGMAIRPFADTVQPCIDMNVLLCLRPALAYDDPLTEMK